MKQSLKLKNIEATDEDVEAELAKMAEMYKMEVEAIKQVLGNLDAIKEDLKIRKAIDFLVENRNTVEAK